MDKRSQRKSTNNIRKRQILAGTLLLVIVAILILLYLNGWARREGPSADLLHHPIYSTYTFEKSDSIIHFGYQPLWIFQNNILEIMKRDAVLKERLGKLGMKLEFHAFLKGEDLNYYVLRNDMQGGTCGDMATLAIASTLSVVVPALTDQGFNEIVARGFQSIGDLKGKRIGYPHGSNAHYALLTALELQDLSENEVKLVPMDVTDVVSAMKKESVEACALWEPTTSLLLEELRNSAVIHRSRSLGFIYFRKDFAETHLNAVLEILASEVRAIRWMLANRIHLLESCKWTAGAVESFTADSIKLNADDLADMITKMSSVNVLPIIPSDALKPNGHLQREYEFLRSLNKMPGSNPWSKVQKVFTNEYIRQILDNPEQYQLNDLRFGRSG